MVINLVVVVLIYKKWYSRLICNYFVAINCTHSNVLISCSLHICEQYINCDLIREIQKCLLHGTMVVNKDVALIGLDVVMTAARVIGTSGSCNCMNCTYEIRKCTI